MILILITSCKYQYELHYDYGYDDGFLVMIITTANRKKNVKGY